MPARASVDQLRDAAGRHAGKRCAAPIAWAIDRVRSGVDSRRETQLRLLLVAGGLPEPDLDVEVAVGAGIVLHPDLSYRTWRVAFEYEGDIHRTDPKQWRRDIERRELLESAGWRVIRVTVDDLDNGVVFLDRVRRIIDQR